MKQINLNNLTNEYHSLSFRNKSNISYTYENETGINTYDSLYVIGRPDKQTKVYLDMVKYEITGKVCSNVLIPYIYTKIYEYSDKFLIYGDYSYKMSMIKNSSLNYEFKKTYIDPTILDIRIPSDILNNQILDNSASNDIPELNDNIRLKLIRMILNSLLIIHASNNRNKTVLKIFYDNFINKTMSYNDDKERINVIRYNELELLPSTDIYTKLNTCIMISCRGYYFYIDNYDKVDTLIKLLTFFLKLYPEYRYEKNIISMYIVFYNYDKNHFILHNIATFTNLLSNFNKLYYQHSVINDIIKINTFSRDDIILRFNDITYKTLNISEFTYTFDSLFPIDDKRHIISLNGCIVDLVRNTSMIDLFFACRTTETIFYNKSYTLDVLLKTVSVNEMFKYVKINIIKKFHLFIKVLSLLVLQKKSLDTDNNVKYRKDVLVGVSDFIKDIYIKLEALGPSILLLEKNNDITDLVLIEFSSVYNQLLILLHILHVKICEIDEDYLRYSTSFLIYSKLLIDTNGIENSYGKLKYKKSNSKSLYSSKNFNNKLNSKSLHRYNKKVKFGRVPISLKLYNKSKKYKEFYDTYVEEDPKNEINLLKHLNITEAVDNMKTKQTTYLSQPITSLKTNTDDLETVLNRYLSISFSPMYIIKFFSLYDYNEYDNDITSYFLNNEFRSFQEKMGALINIIEGFTRST